jgi:hypothetical protein
MDGVDIAFIRLQIVAAVKDLAVEAVVVRSFEEFKLRRRGGHPWTHVGQDEPSSLYAWISLVADLFRNGALGRLPRLL